MTPDPLSYSPPTELTSGLQRTRRSLPIILLQAREAVMMRFRPLLEQHDLTEQQWRALRMLHEFGEMDAGELAAKALVLNSILTRMLRSMEKRHLIIRRKDPVDGRRQLLSLAAAGQFIIGEIAPESLRIYHTIEKLIPPKELDQLLNLLEMVAVRLKAE